MNKDFIVKECHNCGKMFNYPKKMAMQLRNTLTKFPNVLPIFICDECYAEVKDYIGDDICDPD